MYQGGCSCGGVRYAMRARPLFVHACHCTWCQRETGSAFVLNALIEALEVELLNGTPAEILTPSASGKGQWIFRCPDCQVALWSVYSGAGPEFLFLRTGTLDDRADFPPDIHIFTSTKLPWVILPEGVPAVPEYYRREEMWPVEALERRRRVLAAER
jgi:hypothetical protein